MSQLVNVYGLKNGVNFKFNDHARVEDSKIIFRWGGKQFAAANGGK